jgi:Tfp pilus assembly protein PilV
VEAAAEAADRTGMGGIPSPRDESGFGLIELLISIVVLQIALLALVGAFGAGSVALGRAAKINTAAVLADQQMELYRSMPYDAIGLDTASAPTTGTYIADTTVCPPSQNPVCGNSGPVNNTNNSTWSCTAASGSSSVSTYFSANGINPCTAHRVVNSVSTPRSPDSRTYYVDTYIKYGTLTAGERPAKQVSIVVREEATSKELALIASTFDCATGNAANAAPC